MPFPKLTKTSQSGSESGSQRIEKAEKKPKGKTVEKVQKYAKSPITLAVVSLLAVLFFAVAVTTTIMLLTQPDAEKIAEKKMAAEAAKLSSSKNGNSGDVCSTPDCLALSYQMHQWQNPKVNPCDDFYEFACGEYPKYSNDLNILEAKKKSVPMVLKRFLREDDSSKTYSKTEEIMRKLYKTCQEEKRNDPKKAMRDAFAEIKNHAIFPLMDENWDGSKFDLNKALILMAKVGVTDFGLFRIDFSEDGHKKKLSIGGYTQFTSNLEAVDEFLSEHPNLKSWLYSGSTPTTYNPPGSSQKLYDAETEANRAKSAISQRSSSPSGAPKKTLADLKTAVTKIDFGKIVHEILDDPKVDSLVEVADIPLFFDASQSIDLLLDFSNPSNPTKKEEVANLMFFQLFDKMKEDFILDRKSDCATKVIQKMPTAAAIYYTRNVMKEGNRKGVSDLFEDIRSSYLEIVTKSSWLEADSKKTAIAKIEKMRKIVGFGDELEPENAITDWYNDFIQSSASQGSFFEMMNGLSVQNAKIFMQYAISDRLLNPEKDIVNENIEYAYQRNQLNVFFQTFDTPLFDSSWPKYAQIGGVARIIGREMGRFLDGGGAYFDENGERKQWTTPNDLQAFMQKEQCFDDQYKNFVDPDFGPMGGATFGNVADLTATKAAWNAYKKSDASKLQKLSGFEDQSADKLFWQIAALPFCESRANLNLPNGPPGPDAVSKFRVNGVYQNMKEFSDTFKCPAGSPMNPSTKCELY